MNELVPNRQPCLMQGNRTSGNTLPGLSGNILKHPPRIDSVRTAVEENVHLLRRHPPFLAKNCLAKPVALPLV